VKQLLLLRHAKSSWDDPDLDDHERPLNKRGRREAPRIGRLLRHEDLVPDCIVTSTALRARTTAQSVAEACGYAGEVILARNLYAAEPAEYLRVAAGLDEDPDTLLLVGHNPGIEELLGILIGKARSMPTAALARVGVPIGSWKELDPGTRGKLLGFWRAKELPENA
jgi:phosphohistidine phosphatase